MCYAREHLQELRHWYLYSCYDILPSEMFTVVTLTLQSLAKGLHKMLRVRKIITGV